MLPYATSGDLVRIGVPAGLDVRGLQKLSLIALAEPGVWPRQIVSASGQATVDATLRQARSATQSELAREAIANPTNNRRKPAKRRQKSAWIQEVI